MNATDSAALTPSDETLLAAANRGNGIAFAELFDRHGGRVHRHAYRIMQHTQDAEDVTAAVFAELWRKRTRARCVNGSVLPWLLATCTNVGRNASRSVRRNKRLLAHIPRADHVDDVAVSIEDRARRLAASSAVGQALASLPAADASLLTLVMIEDIPLATAAETIGVTYGAAKVRLHRARVKLKSQLATLGITNALWEGGSDE